ncbi:type II secretion system protein [Candidatus Peregrinibacteria bacterium]|nr:type II secretion system protein [Candidatus Peregrinibacteria bacterium]
METKSTKSKYAFTLPEILIAVAIFSTVSMVVSTLYIQSFQETRKANLQNQVYEDARFILQRIAQEARDGMVDYDEYYNQNVVIDNFGQNFGRYYSSFFYPGQDEALGFDCNTVEAGDGAVGTPARSAKRNRRDADCVPLRKTIDRNTGSNPFKGKYLVAVEEDAFCGKVTYERQGAAGGLLGQCNNPADAPDPTQERLQDRLYLISADGFTKTILAREKIGVDPSGESIYALSMLRLKGIDQNGDGIADHFVCADDFQCRGTDDVPDIDISIEGPNGTRILTELPRDEDLMEGKDIAADHQNGGFSIDFVPISPLRVNITHLNFFITPTEDPHYAFSESGTLEQPRVTIVLTVEQNPLETGVYKPFPPITLTQTVSSRVLTSISAPLLIQ